MKKIIIVGIMLVSIASFASGDNSESSDARTAINLTAQEKDFVLERMRRMLETLAGIQQAMVEDSPQKTDDLVGLLFEYTRENHPDGLHEKMPLGFKQMAKQMNGHWKKLKTESDDKVFIQKEVVAIMSTCNACHRTYKIQ